MSDNKSGMDATNKPVHILDSKPNVIPVMRSKPNAGQVPPPPPSASLSRPVQTTSQSASPPKKIRGRSKITEG